MKRYKGKDCNYCKFDIWSKCKYHPCKDCENYYCKDGKYGCKCLEINNGEECPYFKEVK